MATPDLAKMSMRTDWVISCFGRELAAISSDGAAINDSFRIYYKDENKLVKEHPLMKKIMTVLSKYDATDFAKHCKQVI